MPSVPPGMHSHARERFQHIQGSPGNLLHILLLPCQDLPASHRLSYGSSHHCGSVFPAPPVVLVTSRISSWIWNASPTSPQPRLHRGPLLLPKPLPAPRPIIMDASIRRTGLQPVDKIQLLPVEGHVPRIPHPPPDRRSYRKCLPFLDRICKAFAVCLVVRIHR